MPAYLRHVAMAASVSAAARSIAAGQARGAPSLMEDLRPIAGAGRRAREVTTEACLLWSLPRMVGPVCTVVTELVNNVVAHAHTMLRLRLCLRRRYVHVAVTDGDPRLPVPSTQLSVDAAGGRGLALVDAVAAAWGSVPIDGGKVVWATLAIEPEPDVRRDDTVEPR